MIIYLYFLFKYLFLNILTPNPGAATEYGWIVQTQHFSKSSQCGSLLLYSFQHGRKGWFKISFRFCRTTQVTCV